MKDVHMADLSLGPHLTTMRSRNALLLWWASEIWGCLAYLRVKRDSLTCFGALMQIYWDPFQRKINQWHERVVTCYSFGWTGKQEIWILKPNANNLILPSELIIAALQIIPNLVAKNNKIITISSYCSSGIWEWFSWVVLAQGLKWDYNKSVSQDSSHLKSSLSLENPIPKQAPSHGCRLEVSVSHHGTLTRTVHNMVTNFARARDLRERGRSHDILYLVLLEVTYHMQCNSDSSFPEFG